MEAEKANPEGMNPRFVIFLLPIGLSERLSSERVSAGSVFWQYSRTFGCKVGKNYQLGTSNWSTMKKRSREMGPLHRVLSDRVSVVVL